MKAQYVRTAMLLGEDGIENLSRKRVAVFGIGGVGGYVAEALARSGIGALDLIDNDTVCESNLNRQLIALWDTLGQYKVEVMQQRIAKINPDCCVRVYREFYLPEKAEEFPFSEYDYVVDAVDTVTAKLDLAQRLEKLGIPHISCMGTGNKQNPAMLEVSDIYKTSICPLARVMRRELKQKGVRSLKVVWSRETPMPVLFSTGDSQTARRSTPGSTAFVPGAAGLLIASEVIRELAETKEKARAEGL